MEIPVHAIDPLLLLQMQKKIISELSVAEAVLEIFDNETDPQYFLSIMAIIAGYSTPNADTDQIPTQ